MNNQIVLYDNQTVDCLIYSATSFTSDEINTFNSSANLDWNDFKSPKIICNFIDNLTSSYLEGITDKITGYEISKKRPQENFARSLGIFSISSLHTDAEDSNFYSLVDYNVKNNTEYTYFISPLTENYVHTTLSNKVITDWDIFALTPIYKITDNRYGVVRDEFGQPMNWIFQLNCDEGDITLNQDKTSFTTFASKPKIAIGDLNYYSGSLSCLLGNVLYNDVYYEPNILLEKWDKMVKQNYLYLFKNAKGDSYIVSLEDGTKKKYMNEIANYLIHSYNMETAITNRPTTISFNYIEVLDADNIQIYGE